MAEVGAPEIEIIKPIHSVNPIEDRPPNPMAEIKDPKNPEDWAIKIYEKEAKKTGGGSAEVKEAVWFSGIVKENMPDKVLSVLGKLDLPLEMKKALMERSVQRNNRQDNFKIGNRVYNLEQYIQALEEADQSQKRLVTHPERTDQEEHLEEAA